MPQIFVGDTHVGGCDDLYALDHAGKLDPLLAGVMRAALVQLTVTDDPAANLPVTLALCPAGGGRRGGLRPDAGMTNGLSSSRAHQRGVFRHEEDDPTLAALRAEAKAAGIWLLIGSLGPADHTTRMAALPTGPS